MEKFIAGVALVIALGAGAISLNTTTVQGPQGPQGPKGEDGQSIVGPAGKDGRDGIDGVTKTVKETVLGAAGQVFSFPIELLGGSIRGNTRSTTTPLSMTLAASDIINYDTVFITPTVSAVTVTFPASSTLKALVPKAGMTAEQCWLNATGTAAINVTFAAGTGIDLEAASTSLVLRPGNTTCFKYIRKPATASAFDITALITPYVDAD